MIHPSTEVRASTEGIGLGVFATSPIPRGTLLYVCDHLEIRLSAGDFLALPPSLKPSVERFSYRDALGDYILSWDSAKFVNHSCQPNSLTTGYGFEIAIRDIAEGEEITDDYGMLNLENPMRCLCGAENCRGSITPWDYDTCTPSWDQAALAALRAAPEVDQPLLPLMGLRSNLALEALLQLDSNYQSVGTQRMRSINGASARRFPSSTSNTPCRNAA